MKRFLYLLLALFLTLDTTFAVASTGQGKSMSVKAPSTLSASNSGCTTFSVFYKLINGAEDYPSYIKISLVDSTKRNSFAFTHIEYNINNGYWEDNGTPASANIPLEFCSDAQTDQDGNNFFGLTQSGQYYIDARINVVTSRSLGSGNWEEFFVPIKIVGPKITITCVKGSAKKKVSSTDPKCPSGYKKI